MHSLIIGLVVAIMALFPGSAGEGGLNLRAWMESYEKYIYQQMYDNIENARRNEEICQNSAKNEVLHEQTAGEEAERHEHEESAVLEEPKESYAQPISTVETSAPMESESTNIQEATPLYAVNGAILDIGVQEYLYQRLCERGISWFMPYAILMAYQESRFNIYALNQKNLMDSGLFQMRSIYWPEFCAEAGVPCGDIFDPYLQIDVLTFFMARRASWGKTVSEMISAHSQSDYGGYSQEYVDQVMAHQSGLARIR